MQLPIYDLILDVRAAFRALRAFSDQMNEARGINDAGRAVMEYLATQGHATVPQVAGAKSVTRQHIQMNADELVVRGPAGWADNPSHRRSRLLDLSAEGAALSDDIRREEAAMPDRLGQAMHPATVAAVPMAMADLIEGLARLRPDRNKVKGSE